MRTLPALLSIAALVAAPRLASATPSYPSDLMTDLGLTYTPDCTVCHTTDAGGTGTATTLFAVAMKNQGQLMPLNDPTVASALTAIEAAKVDSDCDGVFDPDQLKEGRDPSTGEFIDGSGKPKPTSDKGCTSSSGSGGTGATLLPEYGCGAQAQLAAGPTPWQGAAWIAAVVGVALARRRRRP